LVPRQNEMETPAKLNVSDVVDNSRFGAFQSGILILCSVCLIMDGFDVQAMGYVAPAIIQEWKVPNAQLGPVFSAALVGVLFGSLLLSMLADKIGRRPVLVGATLYFSALTFLTGRTSSVQELLAIRFIAGLGLGCIMPNAMALMGEYSPRKIRITIMTVVAVGFTAGAAIGGFVSAWLIPAFGWRSVFYFGAIVPLVIGVLMFFLLPESLQFMVLRGKNPGNVAKWLKRIDPAVEANADTQYVVREDKRKGIPMVHLFREGRSMTTILLWIINFMNLLNLYFLSNWLPTVVRGAGYSTSKAVLVGTTLQVGGTIGSFALGWLIDRSGFIAVLTPCFALACISISFIGQPGLTLALLFMVVFVAGFCVVGGQAPVNALAGTYYPTYLRSTGIGWGLGIGRMGAIVGPLLGGALIGLKWSTHALFIAAAVPALFSAVVVFCLRWTITPQTIPGDKKEVVVQ
jgi:AAHS family 4-hydroxybenzoate transporter-like MFS transporter